MSYPVLGRKKVISQLYYYYYYYHICCYYYYYCYCWYCFYYYPCSGELRTQKLKSHLVRTQSLNLLPFKPRVGQYIAIHATPTARDFFLAYFSPSGPFICIFFFQNSPFFFSLLAVANTGSCVGPRNKIGHPAWCRFPCWVPAEYKQAKKKYKKRRLMVWWLVKWITWR